VSDELDAEFNSRYERYAAVNDEFVPIHRTSRA
jgi:hypothetical protein